MNKKERDKVKRIKNALLRVDDELMNIIDRSVKARFDIAKVVEHLEEND